MKNDPLANHPSSPSNLPGDLHRGEQRSIPRDPAQPIDDRAWDVFLPEDDLEPLPEEFANSWWEQDEESLD